MLCHDKFQKISVSAKRQSPDLGSKGIVRIKHVLLPVVDRPRSMSTPDVFAAHRRCVCHSRIVDGQPKTRRSPGSRLTVGSFATLAMLTKNSFIEELSKQFVLTARARQWVLSVPYPLRFLFATNPAVMGQVLTIVHRVIITFLIHRAGMTVKSGAQSGAVTLIQRFGSALNLKPLRADYAHCFRS